MKNRNIRTFEEHQVVNFSDLNPNWDAERIVNNKKGLESYMIIDGEWQKSLPNQSTYNRHIYATPEQIEELNNELKTYRESKQKYNDLLSKYKKKPIPYNFI
jgi:hypothetical protein